MQIDLLSIFTAHITLQQKNCEAHYSMPQSRELLASDKGASVRFELFSPQSRNFIADISTQFSSLLYQWKLKGGPLHRLIRRHRFAHQIDRVPSRVIAQILFEYQVGLTLRPLRFEVAYIRKSLDLDRQTAIST